MKKIVLSLVFVLVNTISAFSQMLLTNNYNTNIVVTVNDNESVSVLKDDVITLDVTISEYYNGFSGGTLVILYKRLDINHPAIALDTFIVGSNDTKLQFITTNTNTYKYFINAKGGNFNETFMTFYVTTVNNITMTSGYSNSTVATGISESHTSIANLNVFPNPANDMITVAFNTNKEKTNIEVFDIQGRLVMLNGDDRSIGENKVQLNVTQLSSGIYIVRTGTQTFKITKFN